MVFHKCGCGRVDQSLNLKNMPQAGKVVSRKPSQASRSDAGEAVGTDKGGTA